MIASFLESFSPRFDKKNDRLVYTTDPAVNGYFGFYFEGITSLDSRIFGSELNTYALRTTSDIRTPKVVQEHLISAIHSVEVPDISLKTFTYETVQNFSIQIPVSLDYGSQSASFRFYDTSTGLLFRFFRNWVYACKRPDQLVPTKKDPSLLKCNGILFATDSTLTDITFACGFLGLLPTKIPSDAFNQDRTARNIAIITQTFKYDRLVVDDHIFNFARERLLPLFANHDGVLQWQLE